MLTITTQGSFTSDGLSRIIQVPEGIDWFKVVNWTHITAQTAAAGYQWDWYRGFPINDSAVTGFVGAAGVWSMRNSRTIVTIGTGIVGGLTLIDSTVQLPARQGTTVTSTAAAAPVVQTTPIGANQFGTSRMQVNQTVIRMNYTLPGGVGAAPSIMGIDYTVTAIGDLTHFTLPTHANAIPAAGAGVFTIVSYSPDPLYYPQDRTVINVTQAVQANVTTSVVNNYTVGQSVRMQIPRVCGMIELDQKVVNIVAIVDPYTFTIDVDTTGYTAFTWPLLANYRYQVAQVTPVGETAQQPYVQSYLDATNNVGYSGMILATGVAAAPGPDLDAAKLFSPAGTTGDIVYWQAGKVANL